MPHMTFLRKTAVVFTAAVLAATAGTGPAMANGHGHGHGIKKHHHQVAPGGWRFTHHQQGKRLTSPNPFSGPGYYYASGTEVLTGSNTLQGITANILVANPYMQGNTGEHTLVEEAVADATGHAAEIGWVKDSATGVPRLFASVWTNTNTWAGCYYEGCGWVDWTPSNSADDLGRDLSSVASATFPSNVKRFQLQYVAGTNVCGTASAGWAFYYDGLGVGCYPSTVFTGSFSTATKTYAFGEVYYGGATKPCTDMMNGRQGNSVVLPIDASDPGYIGSVAYINTQPSAFSPTLGLSQTDSNAYTTGALGSTGNRTFTLGGPGYNSTSGTPGNIGAC